MAIITSQSSPVGPFIMPLGASDLSRRNAMKTEAVVAKSSSRRAHHWSEMYYAMALR